MFFMSCIPGFLSSVHTVAKLGESTDWFLFGTADDARSVDEWNVTGQVQIPSMRPFSRVPSGVEASCCWR